LCFVFFCKGKTFVPLFCVCAILPEKAVSEMTYTVSGRTKLYSLTHSFPWSTVGPVCSCFLCRVDITLNMPIIFVELISV